MCWKFQILALLNYFLVSIYFLRFHVLSVKPVCLVLQLCVKILYRCVILLCACYARLLRPLTLIRIRRFSLAL